MYQLHVTKWEDMKYLTVFIFIICLQNFKTFWSSYCYACFVYFSSYNFRGLIVYELKMLKAF